MDITKIWPGKIGSYPRPTEIACIWVEKIYDACSQRECEELDFTDLDVPESLVGELVVECRIIPGSEYFSDWSIEPIDGGPLGRVQVQVCAVLEIILRDSANPVNLTVNTREVCFQKDVILYAPDPCNMEVLAESIFESLACEVSPPNGAVVVTATVGAFVVVKTALWVQLLVPAYGFCPVPPECEELGDLCEQFMERPFPPFFPPQLTDLGEGE